MARPLLSSKELKTTITELEHALSEWESLVTEGSDGPTEGEAKVLEERPPSPSGSGGHFRQRAQALLQKLREQIDELSE